MTHSLRRVAFSRNSRLKNPNSGKEDWNNDLIFFVKVTAGFLSKKTSWQDASGFSISFTIWQRGWKAGKMKNTIIVSWYSIQIRNGHDIGQNEIVWLVTFRFTYLLHTSGNKLILLQKYMSVGGVGKKKLQIFVKTWSRKQRFFPVLRHSVLFLM